MLGACLLGAGPARAVPEAQLEQGAFESTVLPYYFGARRVGRFTGERNITLEYVALERSDEKGALVILPGRGGSHIHHAELLYDLRDLPWSIYVLDHRGQGFSDRLLANRRKGHVEDWDDYARDVKHFMDTVVNRTAHDQRVMLGISMGGAIATTFAQQHPRDLDALALVVPMHKPNYKPFNEPVAMGLGAFGTATFQSEEYGPTQGDPKTETEKFEDITWTGSRARFNDNQVLESMFPELRLGGVTYGWAFEVTKANRQMRARAVEMTLPILLLQAGKDQTVQNDGQDAFCQRARFCRKVLYKNSRHGMLNETDDIRDAALGELRTFLDQRGAGCTQVPMANASLWVLLGLVLRQRRLRRVA